MLKQLRQKTYHLLRWSERHTKTDMVYLAKGGFWLSATHVVTALSSLVVAISFANLLPKETYGTYKYILSIVSILGISTLTDINTSLTQAVAKGYQGSFLPALKTCIKGGLLGSLGSLAVAGYYFSQQQNTLGIAFLVAAIFIPLMDPLSIYNAYLQGKKNFKLSSQLNILSRIAYTIAIVAFLMLNHNVILLLAVYFGIYTLTRYLSFRYVQKKFDYSEEKDASIITYGKHLTFMNIIAGIAGQLDKILVFHYLGTAQLAIYAFATSIPEQFKTIFKNLYSLAFPKLAEKSDSEVKKVIFKKTGQLMIIGTIMTIGYVIIAPFVFRWFLPQYLDSLLFSQIFALSFILHPGGLLVAAMQSQKLQKELYQLNTITPILQIIILFVFLFYYGLMGLILARVLIRLAYFLTTVVIMARTKPRS